MCMCVHGVMSASKQSDHRLKDLCTSKGSKGRDHNTSKGRDQNEWTKVSLTWLGPWVMWARMSMLPATGKGERF